MPAWKCTHSVEGTLQARGRGGRSVDSSQIVLTLPENLYTDAERTFFIDLKLIDAAGKVVSRNFYWVPAR